MSFALRVSIASADKYVRLLPKSFQMLVAAPLQNIPQWTGIAWMETVQNYRRTILGPFWITLNLVIFTVAMTLIYGALFAMPTSEYAAFLTSGMIAWSWNSALLVEIGGTFINYGAFVKGMPINKAIFIWIAIYKLVIAFFHHMLFYVALVILGIMPISLWTLLLVPAVIVMFLISIPIAAIMAILFTRYRDLQRLVSSTMIVFLMITPIFWQTHMVTGWRKALYILNPFYYFVEFMRAPLLGKPPDLLVLGVVMGLFVLLWCLGAYFYRRYEKYVVFWL